MTTRKLTHASLFSGIGGAELAAEWMGWENAFHCEINPFGRAVLDYWFPESESYDDVTKVDFTKWRGRIDVLTAGFPCQPFSSAGRRRGADDDRYLWPQVIRVVRECRPRWILGENVAGILSMVQPGEEVDVEREADLFGERVFERARKRFTIDEILSDIEREGYTVQTLVIPACAVGAPHRRDRVWIVAHDDADADGRGNPPLAAGPGAESERRGDDGQQGERREPPQRLDGLAGVQRPSADAERDRPRAGVLHPRSVGEGQDSPQERRELRDVAPRGLDNGDAPHTHGAGLQATQPELAAAGVARSCPLVVDGNPQRHGLERGGDGELVQDQERQGVRQGEYAAPPAGGDSGASRRGEELPRFERPDWKRFPAQPPVCRRDDGLPFDVDNLTISFGRWRAESLKAYGNAWVPQVAFEIFKAIAAADNHYANENNDNNLCERQERQ